jgi:hypothetical protein
VSEAHDVNDYLEAIRKLHSSIETNLHREPKWSKGKLQRTSDALRTLQEQVELDFIKGGPPAIEDFAAACKYQKAYKYEKFIKALKQASDYWPEWSYENSH